MKKTVMTLMLFATLLTTVYCLQQVPCPTSLCTCHIDSTVGTIINCRHEQLTKIPAFTDQQQSYSELTFSSSKVTGCLDCNHIRQIPAYAFRNVSVSKIDLTRNAISVISVDSFGGLENVLEILLLEGDGTNPFPYDSLTNLVSLSKLHLEHFRQSEITVYHNFPVLPNLKTLVLKSIVDLTNIQPEAFKNRFPHLEEVSLQNLSMSSLPAGALQMLTSLQRLRVVDTKIMRIYGSSFSKLSRLTELDISHNRRLDTIDDTAFVEVSRTLEFLNLAFNNLQYLIFLQSQKWPKLQQLNLSYLPLVTILNGTFLHMPSLLYLKLQSTQIHVISQYSFKGLNQLNTLDLSYNHLSNLPDALFIHCPKLTDIQLQEQEIPLHKSLRISKTTFQGLENTLKALKLDLNRLYYTDVWELLPELHSLNVLTLRDTGLTYIPYFAFRENNRLKELYLSDNKLTQLEPETFYGLRNSLELLDLSSNNLKTIDKCVFQNFTLLSSLFLEENNWVCDCHLTWLNDWFQDNIERQETSLSPSVYLTYCMSPDRLYQRLLHNLTRNELCGQYYVEPVCPYFPESTRSVAMQTTPTTTKQLLLDFEIQKQANDYVKLTWSVAEHLSATLTNYLLDVIVTKQQPGHLVPRSRIAISKEKQQYLYKVPDSHPQIIFCLTLEIFHVAQEYNSWCVLHVYDTGNHATRLKLNLTLIVLGVFVSFCVQKNFVFYKLI